MPPGGGSPALLESVDHQILSRAAHQREATLLWQAPFAVGRGLPKNSALHLDVDLIVLDHAGASDQIQQPAPLYLQVAEGFACSHIGICLP